MRNGVPTVPDLSFAAANVALLQIAMGVQPNGDRPISAGLDLFRDNFNLIRGKGFAPNADGLREASPDFDRSSGPPLTPPPLIGEALLEALARSQANGGSGTRSERGRVEARGTGFEILEDVRVNSGISRTLLVPQNARALVFSLRDVTFDPTGAGPADAFEVALLDGQGLPTLAGSVVLTRTDALLNLQSDGR